MTKTAAKIGVCLLALSLAVGCATGGKGASDEEQIQSLLGQWRDALVAKNVDQLMSTYSENFMSEGNDKAAMQNFVENVFDQGYLDEAEVDLSAAKVVIEGEKATVSPIELSSSQGAMALMLELAKENGQWRIVSSGEA